MKIKWKLKVKRFSHASFAKKEQDQMTEKNVNQQQFDAFSERTFLLRQIQMIFCAISVGIATMDTREPATRSPVPFLCLSRHNQECAVHHPYLCLSREHLLHMLTALSASARVLNLLSCLQQLDFQPFFTMKLSSHLEADVVHPMLMKGSSDLVFWTTFRHLNPHL